VRIQLSVIVSAKRWWHRVIPNLDHRIWILAAGRLLSQIGIGFTLFYAPIFFVNQVGLTATAVGLGLGSQSISGLIGRFLGGSLADSPWWGRRKTLLVSAAISALADGVFVLTHTFSLFVVGNLLMGLGVGLYWPATEATVADLTNADNRNEAFATVRLADSLGLGLGVVMGGALISATGAYRALFVIDGVTFLLFLGIVAVAIAETLSPQQTQNQFWRGWGMALGDTTLLIYVAVNILFTTYLSQVQSTMPVYFNRFVSAGAATQGLSEATLSGLFTWHVALMALGQLPVARWLNRCSQARALMLSVCLWAIGFVGVWLAGIPSVAAVWCALAALTILAFATVAYMPVASSLVVKLAPQNLRGVYLSVNSMCWAIGYLIGPPVGGWALDQSPTFAHQFWLLMALASLPALGILAHLDRRV
jgi:MFS family permease